WPLWVFAASAWQQNPENGLTMPLGWLALSLFGIGAVLALIGLSDTRRRRFQLAGLATVLLLIVAVIAFFVRAASLAGQ
ncbi:MAG: hypothetical protein KDB23_29315, partial [Planctomycetales bacterium]|nr:hypothetical protein [Planctomycetales bacterium]